MQTMSSIERCPDSEVLTGRSMLLALVFSVLVLRHVWSIKALAVYGVELVMSIRTDSSYEIMRPTPKKASFSSLKSLEHSSHCNDNSNLLQPTMRQSKTYDFLPVSTEDSVCDLVLDRCSNFSHGEDSE